ncbi:SusC/RagA family TonB-linked outer membrane protein, partial [Sphingobacterium luzhongxinii]|uniref:SusC/RagA family TonB-linked outer membrane protein n=2 Tax=Sphingobacterium TaxID=28453 RepID=UPI0013DAD4F4
EEQSKGTRSLVEAEGARTKVERGMIPERPAGREIGCFVVVPPTRTDINPIDDLYVDRLISRGFRARCRAFGSKVESMIVGNKIMQERSLKRLKQRTYGRGPMASGVSAKTKLVPVGERPLHYGRGDEQRGPWLPGAISQRLSACLIIFCVVFSSPATSGAVAQTQPGSVLQGEVRSAADGSIIEGATVTNGKNTVRTDAKGTFSIAVDKTHGSLLIKHIGYKEQSVAYDNTTTFLKIQLQGGSKEIEEVEVVSTGYQKIPKERATGSFEFVNNEALNQTISGNIIDRIELQVPGLLVDRNEGAPDKFLIRGRSSIYADVQPLIVLDGFPYDGEIGNINPNDIESVTVLKDAAAASIWGARAGNGVIVITTKQGKSKNPSIAVNSIISLSQKPSYRHISQVSSADYIELEKWLFEKGHYTTDEFFDSMNNGHPPFTPVVELLRKERDKILSSADVERQIAQWKDNDVRKDILRDLYQRGFKQQYGVQVGQQTDRARYIFSAGYDQNRNLLIGQGDKRLNLRVNLETQLANNIWLNNSLSYTNSSQYNGINGGFNLKGYAPFSTGGGKSLYPYAQLRNTDGSPAYLYLDNNEAYVTAQQAKGLDWSYRPIDEIEKIKARNDVGDFLLNTGIRFAPLPDLNLSVQYQFEDQTSLLSNIRMADSYYVRAYVNSFAQLGTNGKFTFPVPKGGIWDTNAGRARVHQGRLQGDWNKRWATAHDLSLMAGWEIRSRINKTSIDRLYGYSEEFYGINPTVDYMTEYVLYNNSFMKQRIPPAKGIGKFTDNFLSVYFNGSYSFLNRYIVSFSIRKDEANLFGVNTNQKGTPLWSSGLRWKISEEPFYQLDWIPALSLRATYGKSGNISRNASALPVIQLANSAYTTPLPTASLTQMPNPDLRWEKVNTLNLGVDFAVVGNKLSGTIAYFDKLSEDVMGEAAIDPTLGRNRSWGNVGEMHAKGFDLSLTAKLMDRTCKWTTTLIAGYSSPKVTKYFMPASTKGNAYVVRVGNTIDPVVDRPVFGMYSFPWIGLDPVDGGPQGMLNGTLSKDYNNIYANTPLEDMLYHGSVQPTVYGSINNVISYQNIALRFMLSYKGGYYFRRPSLSYATLFSSWNGHGEYADRWQQPGDEKWTDVPSREYPYNASRDRLYQYASINVLRGDHLRLENIKLNYTAPARSVFGSTFKQIDAFLFVQNIPLVWLRNKAGMDPYDTQSLRNGIQWSLGLNFTI